VVNVQKNFFGCLKVKKFSGESLNYYLSEISMGRCCTGAHLINSKTPASFATQHRLRAPLPDGRSGGATFARLKVWKT